MIVVPFLFVSSLEKLTMKMFHSALISLEVKYQFYILIG